MPITEEDKIINIEGVSVKQKYTIKQAFGFFISSDKSEVHKTLFDFAFKQFEAVVNTNIDINNISSVMYETYKRHLNESKLAYETCRTYINYMRIFIAYLIKNKIYTKENPFIRLKARDKKFIQTIPDKHFNKILKYLKEKNYELYKFILFLRYTGFRMNEAIQLTWEQIKFNEDIISVITYKDNLRNDIFPLNIENGDLKKFLLTFRKKSGKVFNVKRQWLRQPFQDAIKELNVDNKDKMPRYTIHDIRRTFGSKYAKLLMPAELKTLMRHRDIATTMKFYVNIEIVDIAKKLNCK